MLQRKELRLPEAGEWWRCDIDVPRIAEVVDFVLSDREQRAWDNNHKQDFHVTVQSNLSREELLQASCDRHLLQFRPVSGFSFYLSLSLSLTSFRSCCAETLECLQKHSIAREQP